MRYGVFCRSNLWFIFCPSHCSDVCNILLYWTYNSTQLYWLELQNVSCSSFQWSLSHPRSVCDSRQVTGYDADCRHLCGGMRHTAAAVRKHLCGLVHMLKELIDPCDKIRVWGREQYCHSTMPVTMTMIFRVWAQYSLAISVIFYDQWRFVFFCSNSSNWSLQKLIKCLISCAISIPILACVTVVNKEKKNNSIVPWLCNIKK